MSYIVVDVEADGQVPGINSMVCFGAIIVTPELDRTFYGEMKPISTTFDKDALAISGFSREEHKKFPEPKVVMAEFKKWVEENSIGRPIFITDNPAFDFAYMNYYFHVYCGANPFGFSARRIGDLYCGMMKDTRMKWKHLRKTRHTHHPVDDAKGNAEALLEMQKLGLKIDLT